MSRVELLCEIDKMLELPSGTLQGPEVLAELENWDSMAVVTFIALADSAGGVTLSAKQIGNCETVNDLITLVSQK